MVRMELLERNTWRLEQEVVATIPEIGEIVVPLGYVTDLASIPRPFWFFVGHPATSEYAKPAIVHDWLCDKAWAKKEYSQRIMADAIFFHLLHVERVGYVKGSILYAAVRLWGWISYTPWSPL